MRGALIGLGTIGRGHLAGYAEQDQLEVVAFVDPIGPRALADHQAWRNTPCFDSLSELLESQSLNFIDICTPPNTHLDYIQTGLRHGLHVLCEKPVIHSDDDFRDLRETVSEATSVLFPAHNYLFAPGITRIREVVRHPDFGEIREINFQTLRSHSALGTADWIPHWRRQLSISGGGILRDHGPHSFYVMRHITGLTPQDVSCLVGNTGAVPAGTEGEPAVEDTAVIRVRFHNGIEGRLDLTWAANRRETVYQVRGSRQTVTMIDDEITVTGGSGFSELVTSDFNDVSHSAWFVHLLREFAAAAGANSAQIRRAMAERALQEALDVSAAYESARHGGLWTTVPRAATYLLSDGSSEWSFSGKQDQPLVVSARSAR